MTSGMAAAGVPATLRCSMGPGRAGRRLEQVAQGGDRVLGPGQVRFEAVEVGGDQLVAGVDVGGGEHRLDLVQRHVQGPEAADDLGRRDLVGGVAAVAGGGVDIGRFQQAEPW